MGTVSDLRPPDPSIRGASEVKDTGAAQPAAGRVELKPSGDVLVQGPMYAGKAGAPTKMQERLDRTLADNPLLNEREELPVTNAKQTGKGVRKASDFVRNLTVLSEVIQGEEKKVETQAQTMVKREYVAVPVPKQASDEEAKTENPTENEGTAPPVETNAQLPDETKMNPAKPDEDGKPGEVKPDEVKPGEVKPDEVKPGEVKPGEVKPGEVKPGEVKPGEVKPEDKPVVVDPEVARAAEELRKTEAEIQALATGVKAGAGAAVAAHNAPPAAEKSEKNAFMKGSSTTAVSIFFQLFARLQSDISQIDAKMGIQLRQAMREQLQLEMNAIREEGRLQQTQYAQMAAAKLAGAILSFTSGLGSVLGQAKIGSRKLGTKGTPEYKDARITQKTDMSMLNNTFQTLTNTTRESTDAASNFIQASFAFDIKDQEAKRLMAQKYGESLKDARDELVRKASEGHDKAAQILEALDRFLDKAYQINIGPGQG